MIKNWRWAPAWIAGAVCSAVIALPSCSSDDATTSGDVVAAFLHPDVPLRDVHGAVLTSTSTEPYSPRATCGRCHDVDGMANGYHFQQGRTDANGQMVVRDTPEVVKSKGMYGKW